MSPWPSRGAALALCASVLLAGCAIAPRGSEESVITAADELAQTDFDEVGAPGDDPSGDDGNGPDADGVTDSPGDVDEPDPLPWREFLFAPSVRCENAALVHSEPEPDPLPWKPIGSARDIHGGAHPDSD